MNWGVREWSVLFFKQKTAYEMLISDWSSDVCSSDLLAPLAAQAQTAASPAAPADDAVYTGELMTRWGKEVTPENAWRLYPRPQLEIGRASCRERVCQYV